MNRKRSIGLYQKALELIPGGVNSPVRAFKAIGIPPTFVDRAKGAKIWDVDGNEYIDYIGSWGPMIVGHAHPKVVAALKKAVPKGTSFGAPTPLEVELAAKVKKAFPSMELVRMVSSGTEAVISAIRVARGLPEETRSSSLKAVTTAMATACSSRRAQALQPLAFRTAWAFPGIWPNIP